MEQETMLKEILSAFKLYSGKIDEKLDTMKTELEATMNNKLDELETKMDNKLDNLEIKMDNKLDKLETTMDNKLDKLENKMDNGFSTVNQQLDRLGKKQDGMRVELTETKETVNFLYKKSAQHEEKLHQLDQQQA